MTGESIEREPWRIAACPIHGSRHINIDHHLGPQRCTGLRAEGGGQCHRVPEWVEVVPVAPFDELAEELERRAMALEPVSIQEVVSMIRDARNG